MCAEKPEEAKFPELRPPLEREEPLPLPKECQRPSLIAERKFDERLPDGRLPNERLPDERLLNERLPNDPELRPDENPRLCPFMPREEPKPPYEPRPVADPPRKPPPRL